VRLFRALLPPGHPKGYRRQRTLGFLFVIYFNTSS
jgi:hypothetical protein